MMLGVGLTLSAVALVTVAARDWVVTATERHGASVEDLSRVLDGVAGALLPAIGIREHLF
jgi:ABC-type nickel/cobalt efflux system permease component RcnA